MKKAAVLLADGFEEIEALTAVDLLRRARIYVDTISISDDYMVAGSHGINVQTEALFDEVEFADSGFMVKSCIGVGRYSASAVKHSHRAARDHFAYTGRYERVVFDIGAPETAGDRLDALRLHHQDE